MADVPVFERCPVTWVPPSTSVGSRRYRTAQRDAVTTSMTPTRHGIGAPRAATRTVYHCSRVSVIDVISRSTRSRSGD